MAYDKAVDSEALDTALTYTADRIRNKSGGTAQIPWDSAKGFGDAVDGIETGILPTGTIDITANGTYDVADKATANVSVEAGVDYLEQRITNTLTSYSNSKAMVIALYAFDGCTKLTSVYIPYATGFGALAFANTSIAEYVNISPKPVRIGTLAFSDVAAITKIDFLNVSQIDGQAFIRDSKLVTAIFRNTERVPRLASTNVGAFFQTPIADGTGYIYVPATMVDSYKAATNWSVYADQIRAIEDYPEITGG